MLEKYENWCGDIEEFKEVSQKLSKVLSLSGKPHNKRLIRDYVRRDIITKPIRKPELDPKRMYYKQEHLIELMFALIMKSEGWSLEQIAEFKSAETTERMVELLPNELIGENNNKIPSARSLVQKFQGNEGDARSSPSREAALRHRHRTVSRRRDGERAMQRLGLNPAKVEAEEFTRLTLSSWCHIYFDAEVIKSLSDEAIEIWGRASAQMVIEHIKKAQNK